MRIIARALLMVSLLVAQPQPLMAAPLVLKAGRLLDDAGEAANAAAKAAKATRIARKAAALDRLSALSSIGRKGASAYLTFGDDGAVLVDALGKEFRLGGQFDDLGKFRFNNSASDTLHQLDLLLDTDDLAKIDLDNLMGNVRSLALQRGEKMHRIKQFRVGETPVIGFEESPGLFLDIGAKGLDDIRWIVDRPFFRHDIQVISLFDPLDVDMRHSLGAALGELHKGFSGSLDELLAMISGRSDKTVVIVGHVENGAFVMRDPLGRETGRFVIADIERASREADGTVLFLGCEAAIARAVTGFTGCVRGDRVAASLAQAVGQDTMGGFLGAIARDSGEMLIRPDFSVAERARFEALQVRPSGGAATSPLFSSVGGGTLSSARAADLSWRLIPALPWYWPVLYLGGAVLLMLEPRKSWARWKDRWWDAPDRAIAPVGHLIGVIGRALSFFVLGPALIAYRTVIHVAPWGLLLWMLFVAPLPILSVPFLWVCLMANGADKSDGGETQVKEANGHATGLVTLLVAGGFLWLWSVLFGLPEPYHFFTDRNTTAFTLVSLVGCGSVTFAIARTLRKRGIDPAVVKESILDLPMTALRGGLAGFSKGEGKYGAERAR